MPTRDYLVQLKSSADKKLHFEWLEQILSNESAITQDYTLIKAYAASFNDNDIDVVRANKDVEFVATDGVGVGEAIQNEAPWGLDRISRNEPFSQDQKGFTAFKFLYNYDEGAAGQGVDIYIVDSGVRFSHSEFQPIPGGDPTGRDLIHGLYRLPGDKDSNDPIFGQDVHGHGTHIASNAGGNQCGTAKKANLIDVQVLNNTKTTNFSKCMAAFESIIKQAEERKRPSVVNFSVSFKVDYEPGKMDKDLSAEDKQALEADLPARKAEWTHGVQMLETLVKAVVDSGITFCAAAGNYGLLASTRSPARMREVITVGGTKPTDEKTQSSNYGPAVDIYAPGIDIKGADSKDDKSFKLGIGTSEATGFVSGVVACLISKPENKGLKPLAVAAKLKELAKKVVTVNTDDIKKQGEPLVHLPGPPRPT